jgi:hypothetical protein
MVFKDLRVDELTQGVSIVREEKKTRTEPWSPLTRGGENIKEGSLRRNNQWGGDEGKSGGLVFWEPGAQNTLKRRSYHTQLPSGTS